MTNKELWEQISAKNPSFNSDGNVTLSSKGLRKLFDLAYDKGFDKGKEVANTLNNLASKTGAVNPNGLDAFKDIFGGLGKNQ
jgi:hypothetical protein